MRNVYEDRSVFFVCPSDLIKEHIVDRIFRQEYVVYIVDDLAKMELLAKKFDDALIFINIDPFYEVHSDNQVWKQAIATMFANNESKKLRIGIITNQSSPKLKKICLLECCINSTYITLDKGYTDAFESILATLDVYNVRGYRRYVRGICVPEDNATLSIELDGKVYIGDIDDISSVSVSVRFREDFIMPYSERYFAEVNFNGDVIKVVCKYYGVRCINYEGTITKQCIFMFDFDLKGPLSVEREMIYSHIYSLFQKNINNLISSSENQESVSV